MFDVGLISSFLKINRLVENGARESLIPEIKERVKRGLSSSNTANNNNNNISIIYQI